MQDINIQIHLSEPPQNHFSTHTQVNVHLILSSWNRALCRPRTSTGLHQDLEPVLQGEHVWIEILLELIRIGDDFERPCALGFVGAHLEAYPEVTGVARHAAEGVHGTRGIGFAVIFQPELCEGVNDGSRNEWGWKLTSVFLSAALEALVSCELGDLACHGLNVKDDQLIKIRVRQLSNL